MQLIVSQHLSAAKADQVSKVVQAIYHTWGVASLVIWI